MLLQTGVSVKNQEQNGRQYRSWWDSSLWAISSGSALFAKASVLVSKDERVTTFNLLQPITKVRLFKYIVYWKFHHKKKIKKSFLTDKNSDIFHISTQNIDYGYSLKLPPQGGSNEYPQSMFLSRNEKNNVYACKTQVLLYKSGV